MTPLPRPLARWAALLTLFPDDVAAVLASLVAQLETLTRGITRHRSRRGEPDGVRGLARRGSFESLLVSEWLLQSEVPDEFLRRAVAGELAFVARAYKRDAARGSSLLLFDAGPSQLGAPRLVQLAALLLFAQRATAQKSDFAWGVLQQPDVPLHPTVTQASTRIFLEARTRAPCSESDLAAWHAIAQRYAGAELWIVGAPRLAPFARTLGASLLALDEPVELDVATRPRVVARVLAYGDAEARATATLDLPDARTAVALMRDPFQTRAVAREAGTTRLAESGSSPVVFSASGRQLYARGEGGTLLTIPIPNSRRDVTPPVAVFAPPSGERIVAVGQTRARKRVVVATQLDAEGGGGMALHVLTKRSRDVHHTVRVPAHDGYAGATSATLVPLGVLGPTRACFIGSDSLLVELVDGGMRIAHFAQTHDARALRDGVAFVRTADGRRQVVRATTTGAAPLGFAITHPREATTGPALATVLGGGDAEDLFACELAPCAWELWRAGEAARVELPAGSTVVGVMRRSTAGGGVGLVTLDATRTQLGFREPRAFSTLTTTPAPVASARVGGLLIAYVTTAGDVGVHSMVANETLLSLPLGVAS